ncbi:aminomethyl transferase family protein [Candidatus Sumerlaeota bacterium]|nr:aminomethyl transferase family protein [Candidatus Sumerlaeota bacterium]
MTEQSEKNLPLADQHLSAGARMMKVAGWSLPAHFGDPEAEYWAARKQVALFDASFLTKVFASGADHLEYLNRRLSQRVIEMREGEVLHAAQLNAEGRMEAEMEILHRASDSLMIAPPAVTGDYLVQLADKYVFSEDAKFIDGTSDLVAFGLIGPQAKALCEKMMQSRNDLPIREFFSFSSRFVAGGDLLFATAAEAARIHEALKQLVSDAGGREIGFLPFDTLRIESAIPWWGIDVTQRSIPLDADMRSAIHFNKGCYPGQETIAKITNLGHPARKMVGVVWETGEPPLAGSPLTANGVEAGTLTSSTYSPALGMAIGLATVKWPYRAEGTAVATSQDVAGKVASLPFSSPNGG